MAATTIRLSSYLCYLLWIVQVLSVNRDNFKTCDQSGFCKRHRNVQPGNSPYVVLADSLKITDSQISVHLLNSKTNVRLGLDLYGLQGNTARVKINELEPLKPRYEIPVGDVLIGEPKQQNLKVLDRGSGSVTLGLEKSKIVLSYSPFRVDFISGEEPLVSINSQGLLKFEHFRKKPEAQPEEQAPAEPTEEEKKEEEGEKKEEDVKEPEQEEESGLWEETYKSFHDPKLNGPSSVGIDVSFPGFENVYGIPEHAESMALKTTKDTDPYRLFNLDVFEYELYNPMALYGSVPVMWAHNEKSTVGIYWNNAAETWIDISSTTADKNFFSKIADLVKGNTEMAQMDTHWFSESGIIDIFVMLGPRPKDVFKQYAALTGSTELPPLFAISYHQCRWNYNDQDDVRNVDANMDVYDIPFDVIWLDIEHTDGKRYFTWDAHKFPASKDMLNGLSVKGRKMVTIVDPHLKRDDNYKVYSDAKNRDMMVKGSNGVEYEGWCWPGSSSWPDFLNPEVRRWWASKFQYNEYDGSTPDLYIWNDMNEPSVFNGPEITFHKDVQHYGGFENRDVHNLYGFYVQKATAEGILMRSNNEQRPFVLTRAFFAGSQRFGAVWTGDNMGEWSHLKVSNPMLLTLNLAGITFSGADVGGFFRNPDSELQTRWYQAAAFQPFFRAHAHIDTKRREPFLLPEENMKIVRDAIRLRYSYLPFWYTLFYHGYRSGETVMSPLWVEYPEDKSTFKMDDQYLLGSSLLVKPITEQGSTGTTVYFPGNSDVWYDTETYQSYAGSQSTYVNAPLGKIPVFQRGGAIVPRKMRVRRSSSLMATDPFTLVICLNKQGEALGDLYVDDYKSYAYRNGNYIHRAFSFKNNILQSSNADPNGRGSSKEWVEKLVIVGFPKAASSVHITVAGNSQSLHHSYDSATRILTVRKPEVNIATDFTITIQ
ncbi:neutral alpha-glucosidase AB-like isoform X2 [Ostrea edulis]|uniref:neutral alpha-glucosidase AB-like isoform X2 n=1 Tax=Ostrea edulis TaxID=37623 RepID=UPI0024AF2688|nr:neutral alpha-glucosidase AB-like isoform X2 [Ostrea edulis]